MRIAARVAKLEQACQLELQRCAARGEIDPATGEQDPIQLVLARLTENGCDPRPNGNGWQPRSPLREDRHSSLSIGVGDDGRVLLHDHGENRGM